MQMRAECLDEWLGDFGHFRYEFLRYCGEIAKALGYTFDFSQSVLEAAHAGWRADHDIWLAEKMGSDTSGLSPIKIMALLLHQLCRADWITEVREFENDEFEFNGTDAERVETAKDFIAGREAFFALEFALAVVNWFEAARTDRTQEFVFRMTEDLHHDLLHYLLSNRHDAFTLFLVLKALYARD